jgi:hypothetical protein
MSATAVVSSGPPASHAVDHGREIQVLTVQENPATPRSVVYVVSKLSIRYELIDTAVP